MMDRKKWDLQLFAEGGEGGAPGAAEGGGAAPAEQAGAVQEPALRPAEERQMRRSGMLKKQAAKAPADGPAAQPAPESTQAGKGEAEGEKAAGDGKPGAGSELDKAARKGGSDKASREEFLKFMAENPGQTAQLLREIQTEKNKAEARYAPLMKLLAEKYGTDPGDVEGMVEALKGPVKDDAYYNALAMKMGTSVENAKQMDELQAQNQRLQRSQQRQEKLAELQRQAAAVHQIRERWDQQAAEMQQKYPGFDFAKERQNPDFAAILRTGGSLEAAYRAVHFNELMGQAQAATARQVEQGVVARVEQRAARPAENGVSQGRAGAAPVKDVRKLSARDCEELEKRAARGERITFD